MDGDCTVAESSGRCWRRIGLILVYQAKPMASIDLPYRTTFAAQIRAIEPSETELRETQASLTDLKAMLPPGIDPEENPQLLYIAANLYVAGMVNMNDDGVDIATSLASYKGFEKQQLNIEHDRKRIAGYILHAGLSEHGSDRLISDDEARDSGQPFNVAVVAVLWKVANRELCDFLSAASNPVHPDYKALSLSFEVGFSSYNVGVIDAKTRVIADAARIVRPEDADYEVMSKRLRCMGGSGKVGPDSPDGVYQILSGTFLPLGGGIVSMPAAAVKGITAITQAVEPKPDAKDENPEVNDLGQEKEEALRAAKQEQQDYANLRAQLSGLLGIFNKSSLSRIIHPETRVSPITSQLIPNMKSLQEIKEKMASVQNLDEAKQAVASVAEIAEVLSKASERLSTELEAEKARGAEIERNRAEAQAANDALQKNFEAVQAEVTALKAAQVAAQAEADFNERMATLDEVFELTDDERADITPDIKDLSKDAFAAWVDKKSKGLMKEKTKEFKKKVAADKQKKTEEMCAALKAAGVKVTIDENDLIKEVIASAKANEISVPITNSSEGAPSLKEMVDAEFADNVSIGGKKISSFKKKL